MAISTYAELQALIASRLHRNDLTASIPDFIALAEAKLNRVPKLVSMELDAALLCVVGSRYIALPSDYVSPIKLWLIEATRDPLTPLLAADLPISLDQTEPRYWAIDGENIAFDCPADQAYDVFFRYQGRFTLSDSVTTNWLLTNHPDLYLYAALCEAAIHTYDDVRLNTWKALYREALAEVKQSAGRSKIAVLTTDLPGTTRRGNILRGW
jgi:hypothetical protein